MPDVTGKPTTVAPGPVLASLFSQAHGLAMTNALLTALLCGSATSLLAARLWHPKCIFWDIVLGILIALVTYVVLAPESMVTACLVSARKRFLDDQITITQRRQMRKSCLRKSLLY